MAKKKATKAAATPPTSGWIAEKSGSWSAVAESQDGSIIVATQSFGGLWVSNDFGVTWTDTGVMDQTWTSIAINSAGTKAIAGFAGDGSTAGSAGAYYLSSGSWSAATLTGYDSSAGLIGSVTVTISGNGFDMVVGDMSFPTVWQSTNSGAAFSKITPPSTVSPVTKLAMSRDGTTLVASWGSPLAFLYSGADGMFGSADGVNWAAAENSVAAVGLAWIDNVWVGISIDGHSWRSTDGAKTWVAGPDILNVKQVVAMRPSGVDESGNKKAGVFAAWGNNDAGDGIVYLSSDLGVHFDPALIILAEDGGQFENIESLSGCGGAFFVGTQYSADSDQGSNGKLYVCTDGLSFDAGNIVLGPASEFPATPTTGFSIYGVGYDQSTGVYTLFGAKSSAASGTTTWTALYTNANTPSFLETSTGTVIYTTSWNVSGGHALQNAGGGAAGNGYGAVVVPIENTPASPSTWTFSSIYLTGTKADLFTASDATPEYTVGPVCFKSSTFTPGEAAKAPFPGQKTDTTAMFACVAIASNVTTGVAEGGGVYSAIAGQAFTKTHDGSLIQGDTGGLFEPVGAAVATGVINFSLGSG